MTQCTDGYRNHFFIKRSLVDGSGKFVRNCVRCGCRISQSTPERENRKIAKLRKEPLSKLRHRNKYLSMEDVTRLVVPEPIVIEKLRLQSPLVYVLIDEFSNILYVGSSKSGWFRAVQRSGGVSDQSRTEAYNKAKTIRIHQCKTIKEMRLLEVKLMLKYRPPFNRQLGRNVVINGIKLQ